MKVFLQTEFMVEYFFNPTTDAITEANDYHYSIGRYNLDDHTWKYQHVLDDKIDGTGLVYYIPDLMFVETNLKLHAIDTETDKELWNFHSPGYLANQSTSRFKLATKIVVIPGRNRKKQRLPILTSKPITMKL